MFAMFLPESFEMVGGVAQAAVASQGVVESSLSLGRGCFPGPGALPHQKR